MIEKSTLKKFLFRIGKNCAIIWINKSKGCRGMGKLSLVIGLLILIILGGFLWYDYSKNTTYQEALGGLVGENEKVQEIIVRNQLLLLNKTATTTITDPELIEKLLTTPITIKRNTSNPNKNSDYTLSLQTNQQIHTIGFGEGRFVIDSDEYYTKNPAINPVFMMLIEEDLDWEIIDH